MVPESKERINSWSWCVHPPIIGLIWLGLGQSNDFFFQEKLKPTARKVFFRSGIGIVKRPTLWGDAAVAVGFQQPGCRATRGNNLGSRPGLLL